ncbi:hypothetical protein [Bradyrhizobium sp. 184]|uniref:hypothetical protein n=1 Tax=Bradyrhizobium sp. 184 TaxID=2782653 RepID=UPI003530527C
MWGMYKNRAANTAIPLAGVVVFAGSLWLVRSQERVGDVSYMKAMIPSLHRHPDQRTSAHQASAR